MMTDQHDVAQVLVPSKTPLVPRGERLRAELAKLLSSPARVRRVFEEDLAAGANMARAPEAGTSSGVMEIGVSGGAASTGAAAHFDAEADQNYNGDELFEHYTSQGMRVALVINLTFKSAVSQRRPRRASSLHCATAVLTSAERCGASRIRSTMPDSCRG